MFSREKTKSAKPGDVSRPGLFSAIRAGWSGIFSRNPDDIHEDHPSLRRDFGKKDVPVELQGIVDILKAARRKILTNVFLQGLTNWWTWILAGLILVGAVSAKMAGAMILAVTLAIVGAVLILAWIFRTRLSIYRTACRLDSAAGLHDRVSTAIFLADIPNPDEMMVYQRRDAIARLGKVDPRGLFPIRMPATAGRALLLFLAAGGLLAYRMHHKPPLVTLLQNTARSQLVQSIISPLVRTLENDLQRTISAADSKQEPSPDEVRPGDPSQPDEDLWQNGDDKDSNSEEAQEAVTVPDQQDQMQPAGDGSTLPPDESADPADAQQSPQDMNGNENPSNPGDQQSADNRQSMNQSLMQALKNMMPNPSGAQQPNNRQNQQPPPNQQGMPQSGDSHQPGQTASDKQNDSRGRSDAQQKPSENSSSGAGNQAGTKELKPDLQSHLVKAVPDRVALAPSGFKDPTRIRNSTDTGTATMATGNASPQAAAAMNGAEQEDIPARYRLYVQHYFEHSDSGQ